MHAIERIRHVVGMKNYSLCLRNCEHVGNYIFTGKWVSTQMSPDESLVKFFKKYFMKHTQAMVNSFPASIRPHLFTEQSVTRIPVYSFLENSFSATGIDYYLDAKEHSYNIAVFGPTGSGKSHLINVLFNHQGLCASEASHKAVTREVFFVRGRGEVLDVASGTSQMRDIVIADTVGLCDTEWDDTATFKLIESRVTSNMRRLDAVIIVFRCDRLEKQHIDNIKVILKWLNYSHKNFSRFIFVSTKADFLEDGEIEKLRQQAIHMLGLISYQCVPSSREESVVAQTLTYTGLGPEDALSEKGLQRVKHSVSQVREAVFCLPASGQEAIRVPKQSACAIL